MTGDSKQLYKNSSLFNSIIEADYLNDDKKLQGDRMPNLAVVHEKPEHRLMLFLKAEGFSNREVATKSGYTECHISQVTRQPWFKKRLLEEIHAKGGDAVETLLKMSAEDSVFKLISLRDQATNEYVQRAAADSLLDRYLGKPTQHIKSEVTTKDVPTELHELKEELSRLDAEERQLLGRN